MGLHFRILETGLMFPGVQTGIMSFGCAVQSAVVRLIGEGGWRTYTLLEDRGSITAPLVSES